MLELVSMLTYASISMSVGFTDFGVGFLSCGPVCEDELAHFDHLCGTLDEADMNIWVDASVSEVR